MILKADCYKYQLGTFIINIKSSNTLFFTKRIEHKKML
jgi:hypothetical protein